MDEQESIDRITALHETLREAIFLYLKEWDINYMELIGTLESLKFECINMAFEANAVEDEE